MARWLDQNRYRFAGSALRVAVFFRATVRFTDAFRPGALPPIGFPASIHACTRSSLILRAFGIFAHLRNAPFCSASSLENSVLPFAAPVGAAPDARDARALSRTEARPPARRAL
jgi:hypothetical protein